MQDPERYERARRRVRQIKGFYIHASIYVLINCLLAIINWGTSRGEVWFYWPLFGWGIGLAAHAIAVFGLGGVWGPEWEERKIREMLEKGDSQ
jgi:hypothetical protein